MNVNKLIVLMQWTSIIRSYFSTWLFKLATYCGART